eukprot:3620032-Prymnesium_polylepis.1
MSGRLGVWHVWSTSGQRLADVWITSGQGSRIDQMALQHPWPHTCPSHSYARLASPQQPPIAWQPYE